MKSYIMKAKVV